MTEKQPKGKIDPEVERLLRELQLTYDAIRDVLEGRRPKPGGDSCTFPHCSCNSPWELCEKAHDNKS